MNVKNLFACAALICSAACGGVAENESSSEALIKLSATDGDGCTKEEGHICIKDPFNGDTCASCTDSAGNCWKRSSPTSPWEPCKASTLGTVYSPTPKSTTSYGTIGP